MATWSFLQVAALAAFVVLVVIDAATSKTEHKLGLVEVKHFSPEFTAPSVQLETSSKEEAVTVPTQQTYPESYEVEIDERCSSPSRAMSLNEFGSAIGSVIEKVAD